jgi:hypothetical protein
MIVFDMKVETALCVKDFLTPFDALPCSSVCLKLMLPPGVSTVIARYCISMTVAASILSIYSQPVSSCAALESTAVWMEVTIYVLPLYD